MKVVIIGGTGLIGQQVGALLRQGGHDVLAAAPSVTTPVTPKASHFYIPFIPPPGLLTAFLHRKTYSGSVCDQQGECDARPDLAGRVGRTVSGSAQPAACVCDTVAGGGAMSVLSGLCGLVALLLAIWLLYALLHAEEM